MLDRWVLIGDRHDVLIVPAPGGRVPAGATRLAPASAAFRLRSWIAAHEAETRPLLAEIAAAAGWIPAVGPFTPTREIAAFVAEALLDGRLVAFEVEPVLAAAVGVATLDPGKEREPAQKTWIAVELRYKADSSPVAGARYTLVLPDGSTQSGTLDKDGRARADNIDPGTCDVDFPDFAPKEWGATPQKGGGFDHRVQQGDCLSSLAERFGFADWRTIYDADENAELRDKRKKPSVVFPGDLVHIPGKKPEPVERPTGKKHVFQLIATKTRFRLQVKLGVPIAYDLDIEGTVTSGDLDDGGLIDVPIARDARSGKLTIWPNRDKEQEPVEWQIDLGALDPVEEDTGARARLNNLGYFCGEVDGAGDDATGRALRAFQEAAKIAITGKIDDATRDALRGRHDA